MGSRPYRCCRPACESLPAVFPLDAAVPAAVALIDPTPVYPDGVNVDVVAAVADPNPMDPGLAGWPEVAPVDPVAALGDLVGSVADQVASGVLGALLPSWVVPPPNPVTDSPAVGDVP